MIAPLIPMTSTFALSFGTGGRRLPGVGFAALPPRSTGGDLPVSALIPPEMPLSDRPEPRYALADLLRVVRGVLNHQPLLAAPGDRHGAIQ